MGDTISMIKDADHVTFYGKTDTVLSIIANVMLVVLYLSPIPTFWRMIKKGSTEEFHPFWYMIGFGNCSLWWLYAFSVGQPKITPFNAVCLSLSNQIGTFLSIWYFAVFSLLTTDIIRIPMFFLVNLPACVILFLVGIGSHRFLGPAGVVYGIIMYASPLFTIGTIYQTKSAEYLPFWLCVACFLNGVFWVIYSCVSPAPLDLYITITNSVGLLLGMLQLLVYYKFHVKPCTVNPEGIEAI